MADHFSTLKAGDAITRWLYSDATTVPFYGPLRPTPDYVTYEFGLVGTKTGQSPARERLQNRSAPTKTDVPTGPFNTLYVGSYSPNVDFSTFAYTPKMITRSLRCLLVPQHAGPAQFRIATCGQVRLWLGDKLIMHFAPFLLNTESAQEITIDLPAEPVTLTVELEDIHERNTENYMSVTWLGGTGVSAGIDHPQAVKIMAAGDMMDLLEGEPIIQMDNTIGLASETAAPFDMDVTITSIIQIARGDCAYRLPQHPIRATMLEGARKISLPQNDETPTGACMIAAEVEVAGIRIPRSIGTTILTRGVALTGETVEERKAEVLEIAKSDTGIEATVALVHCAQGHFTERTRIILEQALNGIEEQRDCSDFTMLPVLRIWRDHRDVLPQDIKERIKTAILGYRYWMTEPGNDAMWFWSENHVLCFHVAQLIAGDIFGDTVFTNSGQTGTELKAEAYDRLHRWFDGMDRDGLCEWNSAAYYPIDLLALLSLHDMTSDTDLQARSVSLMDQIFVMTGLHMIGGSPAGAQGRSYEKELLTGPINELGTVGAVAFSGIWYPEMGRASLTLCLSDYMPPKEVARLAAPQDGDIIEARYFQGAGVAGKLTLWKDRHVQLSTVSEHMVGQLGSQQHLLDVYFAANPFARMWINHPGDRKPWSERRPSKLAGNHWLPHVVQHERCALAIYDIPDDTKFVPFSQLFAVTQAFDQIDHCAPHIVLLRSGASTAVVHCSTSLQIETEGPYKDALYRANALRCGWAVVLEDTPDDAAYDAVKNRALAADFAFDDQTLHLKFNDYALTFDGAFTQDNAPLTFDWPGPAPTFTLRND